MLTAIFVAVALGLGALVQTIAGFGSALVVMPLLTHVIGVKTAVPVQVLVGALVTVTVLFENRKGLRWREALQLVSGSVIGIPLGTMALKSLPPEPVTAFLGVLMLGYGLFAFVIQPRLGAPVAEPRLRGPAAALTSWAVGFSAGVLGGAYATDGPPLIIYGAVKQWPKETFKSILQACFLVDGVAMLICHSSGGLITRDVVFYSIWGVPGILAGTVAGVYLDRRIDHERFRKILLWLIVVLGLSLLAGAFIRTS